jgi:HEPN domain-containing protein
MPDSLVPAEWYTTAKSHLYTAEKLQKDPVIPQSICLFHLQQTAEMILRGKLLEMGATLRKIHSIALLQAELSTLGISFTQITDPAVRTMSTLGVAIPPLISLYPHSRKLMQLY